MINIIANGMDDKIHVSRNRDSLGVFTEEQLKMALGRGSVYAGDKTFYVFPVRLVRGGQF